MIKYKLILTIFLLFFFEVSAIKADNKTKKKFKVDSTFIQSYRDQFCFTLSLNHQTFGIGLYANDDNPFRRIKYRSNNPAVIGLGIDYKWFTFEASLKLKNSATSIEQRGDSERLGFKFGITGSRIWLTGMILVYEGMYLENADIVEDNYLKKYNQHPKYPNLRGIHIQFNTTYAFNGRKFSQTANLWQTEAQRKSAGSFFAGAGVQLNIATSDKNLIPTTTRNQFDTNLVYKGNVNVATTLFGGYSYTFVIKKKCFFNLGLSYGAIFQNGSNLINDGASVSYQKATSFAGNSRISIGYNGERYYFGLQSINDSFMPNKKKNSVFSYETSINRVFVGYRIKPRKKTADNLKKYLFL